MLTRVQNTPAWSRHLDHPSMSVRGDSLTLSMRASDYLIDGLNTWTTQFGVWANGLIISEYSN